jgi:hypothetical protein
MMEKNADSNWECNVRNRSYGKEDWQIQQAKQLGLLHTIRHEDRPNAIRVMRHPKN